MKWNVGDKVMCRFPGSEVYMTGIVAYPPKYNKYMETDIVAVEVHYHQIDTEKIGHINELYADVLEECPDDLFKDLSILKRLEP